MFFFLSLIKTCNTDMQKMAFSNMFLSISQIDLAGTLQHKARQGGKLTRLCSQKASSQTHT